MCHQLFAIGPIPSPRILEFGALFKMEMVLARSHGQKRTDLLTSPDPFALIIPSNQEQHFRLAAVHNAHAWRLKPFLPGMFPFLETQTGDFYFFFKDINEFSRRRARTAPDVHGEVGLRGMFIHTHGQHVSAPLRFGLRL